MASRSSHSSQLFRSQITNPKFIHIPATTAPRGKTTGENPPKMYPKRHIGFRSRLEVKEGEKKEKEKKKTPFSSTDTIFFPPQ